MRATARRLAVASAVLAVVGLPPLGDRVAAAAVHRRVVVPCRPSKPTCWPAAFAFAPGDRIFFAERLTADIRVFNKDTGKQHLWKHVGNVETRLGETGVVGIAVDPAWPTERRIYVYYTQHDPFRNVIVRFTEDADGIHRNVLATIPAGAYHDGGVIHFGPDGMLYAVTGETGVPRLAQDKDSKAGKVLRMEPDGDRPPDNPLPGKIYSYGHRNSFGFGFDPETDHLWQSENGPECNDEMNRIIPGRNYGWGPRSSCPNTNRSGPNPVAPRRRFNPVIAPTGVAFCDGCGLGHRSGGAILMGSWNDGKIRRLRLTGDRKGIRGVRTIFDQGRGVLAVESGPGGSIHFSDAKGIYRLVR